MRPVLLLFVIILGVGQINTWRIFHLGRRTGGNLPPPEDDQQLKDSNSGITEEYFTQKLDHSKPTDTTTWQQRYFANDQYYTKSGVVFLMIGGEGEASSKWMNYGAWIEYAKRFGAFLFQLEHRFYGKSHPTTDMSTENLKYLTSEQALSDLATFIVAMNEKYKFPSDVKWIAFGGSYPGSLATWLRFKYPHLVRGAMSASGPLKAIDDFKDYLGVVQESLATYSEDCPTQIQKAVEQIDSLIASKDTGDKLKTTLNLCDSITTSLDNNKDISNLYEAIADNFAGIVQYNHITTGMNIEEACEIMTNETVGDALARLGKFTQTLLTANGLTCLDYKYDTMVKEEKSIDWSSSASEGGRQWMYQTCTEFGFYQTSSQKPQIFGDKFPLSFFNQLCEDIFGTDFDATLLDDAIDRTNTNYGALQIEVSNVVFVHGSIDPWHALGITEAVNSAAPAIYIKGTAHCANMYPEKDGEPEELSTAREEVGDLIAKWLNEPDSDNKASHNINGGIFAFLFSIILVVIMM